MSEEHRNDAIEEHLQPKYQDKVFEKNLLASVSKTHSVYAFFQSFGIDILVYGLVFMAGQQKASPLWMIPPIATLVIKDIWSAEREKRQFDKIIKTLRNEDTALVLSDSKQLPPWVYFPDIERCNWLNKLMIHFWPYISEMATEKILLLAEPVLTKKATGLKLKKVSLGMVPPTISGIKVYDKKVSDSHLIIDANLCYSGDSEFSITYRGIPGGIENVQLRGPARIDLLITEELPFIAGVDFSFLGQPELDFVLTGVGSLGFIEEILRTVINGLISSHLVFPKKFSKVWAKSTELTIQDPEGVIRVNVIEAKNLDNKDTSLFKKNLSDPYAEVSYGSRTFWSRVVDDSLEPYWDLWCEFVKGSDNAVVIRIMDKDPGADDVIGTYSLNIPYIKKEGKLDSWVNLERSKGSIHIRACFLELSADVKQVKFPPEDLSFLSSYVLTVLVKSAHNLLVPRSLTRPSSSVQLIVGNETQETQKVENSNNPVFGESFNFFVNNPDFNKLRVKVVDDDGKIEIGSFSYSLRKLLDRKDLEIEDQHFPLLDSASDSTIIVSMRLRLIKNVFF